jgi:hypothetical protein
MKKLIATLVLFSAVLLIPVASGSSEVRRGGPTPFPCWPNCSSVK